MSNGSEHIPEHPVADQILNELHILNLMLYAKTYPMMPAKAAPVRDEVERRLFP